MDADSIAQRCYHCRSRNQRDSLRYKARSEARSKSSKRYTLELLINQAGETRPPLEQTNMSYTFDLSLQTGTHTVEIDTVANYGYFENNKSGTSGGLWFDKNESGALELQDYDGVFELPFSVVFALKKAGVIFDDEL